MITFIRNHKYLSAAIAVGVIFLVLFIYFSQKTTPNQNKIPAYNSITPGSSTKNDVIGKLGQPLEQKQVGENELLTFKSDKTERADEYYFQNGVNRLTKEIIPYNDTRKIDDIRKVYGNANLVLYGEGAVGGFYLFVYLNQGIAYIGNPNSGTLLEIWYFTPMSETEFVQNFATGYSKTQPSPEEQRNNNF